MKNYAGRNDVDDELREELTLAGIEVYEVPEFMRGLGRPIPPSSTWTVGG
jgi:hypothetical protein